jgi:ribonuclease HII
MTRMHDVFPAYDFDVHKGYCTKEHQAALDRFGPCPEHRRRFINVRRTEPDPLLAVAGAREGAT